MEGQYPELGHRRIEEWNGLLPAISQLELELR